LFILSSRKASSMRVWDKIFTIFQTESVPSSSELNSAHTEEDGFQRFMKEYAKQQGTTLRVVRNGIRGATHPGARLYDVGNGGCSLRVVWQFYRWLYPHSAWASRVRPSDVTRQAETIIRRSAFRAQWQHFADTARVFRGGAGSDQKEETDKQESQAGEVTQVSSPEARHQPQFLRTVDPYADERVESDHSN
jgi:hypothetical protein